ncbi:DciA family protein [Conexibacter arvalis]|uniref:Putative nucleic acid-binding Zn ribbon protein n=1 Tax=Conexibacter arvalis TaxID=912552 RepID=A0A840IA99_9ACTN|nr:putative nucleic acid-binding Zn ribbon protein [Conexibacter arvalis]
MRRRAPRPIGEAVEALQRSLAPATLLAEVQRAWPGAVGPLIAREAEPVFERGGTVTVACSSATWANELALMAPAMIEQLNGAIGRPAVRKLRCVTGTRGGRGGR